MKVLMLTPFFHPHLGGVEKHVKRVSEELTKKGHNVTIITLKHDANLADIESMNSVRIYRFPKMRVMKVLIWLFKNKNLIKNADVVHCHDFGTFIFRYFPFRFLFPSKPVFITFHGFEGIFPIPKKIWLLRKITEWLTKGNICVGDFIPKWYGTKADFISYGGIDNVSKRKSGDDSLQHDNSIIFVGRLENDTGILKYIDALKILNKDYKINFKVHVCGDGNLYSVIKKIIDENKLDVEFHGFIEPSEFITKTKFAFVSGYLAILEAMINKQLVFSIYENELKKDYLTLIPNSKKTMIVTSSADELAKQFVYHLENQHAMIDKIENGYSFAKEQTWERVAETYLKLWKKNQ